MADTNLTQAEADALISIDKAKTDTLTYSYPNPGEKIGIPLISSGGHEQFVLDVRRGRLDLAKVTNQMRGRQVVILVRLDLAGPPHTNPDGEVIPCPHLHIYREGYADKWASQLPPSFSAPTNLWTTLQEFMTFCHIVDPPHIARGLFT